MGFLGGWICSLLWLVDGIVGDIGFVEFIWVMSDDVCYIYGDVIVVYYGNVFCFG